MHRMIALALILLYSSAFQSNQIQVAAPLFGANIDESAVTQYAFGPRLISDNIGNRLDAASPPPCTSNCAFAYPASHKNRSDKTISDTEYLQSLIDRLAPGGRIYIHPGHYLVDELILKDNITLAGLYHAMSAPQTVVFSGFMQLRNWRKLSNTLWVHQYPFPIVNYDSGEGAAYFCKDPATDVCKFAQDLIVNGVMQSQWACEDEVGCVPQLEGQWFIDRRTRPDSNPTDNFILLRTSRNPNTADTRISHNRGAFREGARTVKVRNINFKGYTLHSMMTDDNWGVTNCIFEKNGVTGLSLRGKNVFVARNVVSENGCTGMQGTLRASTVKNNKIVNNNVMGHKPGMHAGGIKLIGSRQTSIEANYVIDNEGAGIWVDIGCIGVAVHDNVIVETKNFQGLQARGIQYELSQGTPTDGEYEIFNNLIKVNNGIAGIVAIYALNSQYLDIQHNTIRNAQNGILIKQDARGYEGNCANGYAGCMPCDAVTGGTCDNACKALPNTDDDGLGRCLQQVRNIKVHYNDITVGGSGYLLTGLILEPTSAQLLSEPGGISATRYYDDGDYKIDIDYNNYHTPGDPRYAYPFQWGWDAEISGSIRIPWALQTQFHDAHSCLNGECSAGNASLASAANISVYPNPFAGTLNVRGDGLNTGYVAIELISDRNQVYRPAIGWQDKSAVSFNTSTIPPGTYVLRIFQGSHLIDTRRVQKS